MEIRNIAILNNDIQYTKEQIIAEIKAEGYPHNFLFISDVEKPEDLGGHFRLIDEVWLFGDCTPLWQYSFFKAEGADLWNMG